MMLKSFFFFLLFSIICSLETSAQKKLDSLLNKLNRYKKEDTIRLNLLNNIAGEYKTSTPSKGVETADTAIALAKKLYDKLRLAEAYRIKGENYSSQNKYTP